MIVAIALAAALQQSALQSEAPALIRQAVVEIGGANSALHYTLGECAAVYPAARQEPAVEEGMAAVDRIRDPSFDRVFRQFEAEMLARGIEAGAADRPSVSDCARMLRSAGNDLRQQVEGYEGLMRQLSRP